VEGIIKMNLERMWEKYSAETEFNYWTISKWIEGYGTRLKYDPNTVIISRGDFPQYVYFLVDGIALGLRDYEDGKDYSYFQVDKLNGNIGLLEVLARKDKYVATITSLTKVELIRIDSTIVYEQIMSDLSLLRRCSVLLAEDLYNRSGNDGIFYHFKGIDRVRYYIIRYYETNRINTETIQLKEHYNDIANQIGVSVRTVGRSMKQLKELSEISSKQRRLFVSYEQYKKMNQHIYR